MKNDSSPAGEGLKLAAASLALVPDGSRISSAELLEPHLELA